MSASNLSLSIITSSSDLPKDEYLPFYYSSSYLKWFVEPYHPWVALLWSSPEGWEALIVFGCVDNCWISLKRAPFGGIWVRNASDQLKESDLITDIRAHARLAGVQQVHIHSAPEFYNHYQYQSLNRFEGESEFVDHYVITVDHTTFSAKCRPSARKKLQLLKERGYCTEIEPIHHKELYELIALARHQRKYDLLFDLEMAKAVEQLQEANYLLFVARQNGDIAALGLVVKVNDRVLYHYQPADFEKFRKDSPLLSINAAIYHYAQTHGYPFIDLGSANLGEEQLRGLIQFKISTGAAIQTKTITRIDLSRK